MLLLFLEWLYIVSRYFSLEKVKQIYSDYYIRNNLLFVTENILLVASCFYNISFLHLNLKQNGDIAGCQSSMYKPNIPYSFLEQYKCRCDHLKYDTCYYCFNLVSSFSNTNPSP